MKVCPKCIDGFQWPNFSELNFCPTHGIHLVDVAERKCECGRKVGDSDIFCMFCGAKLK